MGPWALTWLWDTPENETFFGVGYAGFRKGYSKESPESIMQIVWESLFKNSSFPSRQQYAISAGSMWWSRSAPLLEDEQLRSAASWFVPSLTEYVHPSRSISCQGTHALERILPTLFRAWYGLVCVEAPNK